MYVHNLMICVYYDIFTCGSMPYLGVVMLEVVLHRVGVVVLCGGGDERRDLVSDRQHESHMVDRSTHRRHEHDGIVAEVLGGVGELNGLPGAHTAGASDQTQLVPGFLLA